MFAFRLIDWHAISNWRHGALCRFCDATFEQRERHRGNLFRYFVLIKRDRGRLTSYTSSLVNWALNFSSKALGNPAKNRNIQK